MEETAYINIALKAQQIIYSFQEGLKSYNKLRLKGRGTRDYHYLINVPKLYVGEKYCPDKKYSISYNIINKISYRTILMFF